MQEQWSLTDLRTPGLMEGPVLPAGLDQAAKQTLPGRYHLQVLSAHDAGSPAYGQLQKLHQVETAALQHSSTLTHLFRWSRRTSEYLLRMPARYCMPRQ